MAEPDCYQWFRYVRDHREEAYRLVGWATVARLDGAHEGKVLMRYGRPSDTEPPEPASNAAVARSIGRSIARTRAPARGWRR